MTLMTLDLKLDGTPVLTVETEISARMADAFIDTNSNVLETAIRDLHRQIQATDNADAERLKIG